MAAATARRQSQLSRQCRRRAGSSANLTTATINQIIVNTENNAIAAFYGTQLSYWTRIDLYDAAGYLNNLSTGFTGSLITASGDKIPETSRLAAAASSAARATVGRQYHVQVRRRSWRARQRHGGLHAAVPG